MGVIVSVIVILWYGPKSRRGKSPTLLFVLDPCSYWHQIHVRALNCASMAFGSVMSVRCLCSDEVVRVGPPRRVAVHSPPWKPSFHPLSLLPCFTMWSWISPPPTITMKSTFLLLNHLIHGILLQHTEHLATSLFQNNFACSRLFCISS